MYALTIWKGSKIRWGLILTSSGVFVADANCLRLNEVRIPMHTVRDLNARLECHFDLEGEALYSVKWYKDGNEFFRFVPRDQPPAQLFPLPGVSVDVSTHSLVTRGLLQIVSGQVRSLTQAMTKGVFNL